MIFLAVCTVLSFLQVLSLEPAAIVNGIINVLFFGYLSLVIRSLYEKFRDQNQNNVAVQHSVPQQHEKV